MVKKVEQAKPPTIEERALVVALAVMKETQGQYMPQAKLCLFRNRNSNYDLEHLYYDGYRDGLAEAVKMLLTGQLDIQEPKDVG